MKVDKLQTINFGGLSGKREYEFPNRITALSMPNGSGKTSVLSAIRTAITGDTKGTSVYGRAACYDVGVLLSNGDHIIREVPRQGSGRQWYNKKQIATRELDRVLGTALGIPVGTLKIVTASEVVAHMKPQELSELMLSYIPETLDAATVVSYLSNPTEGMKKIAMETLPSGNFGMAVLDKAYNTLYDQRKALKKSKAEAEALVRVLSTVERPKETKEELLAMLEKAQAVKTAEAGYKAANEAFLNARAHNQRLQATIKSLEDKLDALGDVQYDESQTEALQTKLSSLHKEVDDVKRLVVRLRGTAETLTKTIGTLNQPVCPISEKLVCTTDKSAVKDELQNALNGTEEEIVLQEAKIKQLADKITSVNAQLRTEQDKRTAATQKAALEEQLKQAKGGFLTATEPPKPAADALPYTEDQVRSALRVLEDLEKASAAKRNLEELTARLYDVDSLVTELGPKGPVKEKVTGAYISAFEDVCNNKADGLRTGMKMRFMVDNGITPLLDVKGDGNYLPYSLLSGGEKIYMIFLLLDMFNAMCGLKMLILDELSVLDASNFGALLDILEKHTEEYDQVLLSTVNHDGLTAELKKRSIPVIETLETK